MWKHDEIDIFDEFASSGADEVQHTEIDWSHRDWIAPGVPRTFLGRIKRWGLFYWWPWRKNGWPKRWI